MNQNEFNVRVITKRELSSAEKSELTWVVNNLLSCDGTTLRPDYLKSAEVRVTRTLTNQEIADAIRGKL